MRHAHSRIQVQLPWLYLQFRLGRVGSFTYQGLVQVFSFGFRTSSMPTAAALHLMTEPVNNKTNRVLHLSDQSGRGGTVAGR